jgi:signal transduction histidine kinase/CheY-like chemotaxis protein
VSFRNLSIRKKLSALMMLISVLILTLVFGLYISEEIYSTRTFLKQEMISIGATLGESCKKLLINRNTSTTEDILASLQVQTNIRAAYLFDEDGIPVAEYLDASAMSFVLDVIQRDFADHESKFWVDLQQQLHTYSRLHFGMFMPIKHDGRQVGTIYLMRGLQDLYGRLAGVVFLLLLLLGPLLLLSWWLGGRLQRPVSVPLLNLVDTMGAISQGKDYSLRAEKQGQDEIGRLVDGFNQMLEQIEGNRQQLLEHQQSLETTVEKRTEELRQMVAVLEIAKQQAESASEAKSQFLANITHELRTPLIGVLGMNELLFRTSMNEQQKMLATTVQHSGEDLLTLINNVLDFSKIEAGKLELEETEFALYQVADEVVGLLAGAAAEKGLSLYTEIPLAATCRVLGDEVRIRQILMNLVGNAIKFTETGSVTVKLASEPRQNHQLAFTLEVIDTGIGMDAESRQQIFSAFYQADTSHTRKYGGTGLGLAIVLQLIQLLDGTISLDSEPGRGSHFRLKFVLPIAAQSKLAVPDGLQQQVVLLCLDDKLCQRILAARLKDWGLRVVETDSVADAWYQIGAAQRSNKPFQLAFLSPGAELPDGQPLYLAVREQADLAALRRILVMAPSQGGEAVKQEHKLYLPISWDKLHETLCQCWHELHLVEPSLKAVSAEKTGAQEPATASLLLVGGSVASRELIKLSLANAAVVVETAKELSELPEKLRQQQNLIGCLVDLASVSAEQLADCWCSNKIEMPLLVLHSATDQLGELPTFAAALLEKPFKLEDFLPLLQPLLATDQDNPGPAIEKGVGR